MSAVGVKGSSTASVRLGGGAEGSSDSALAAVGGEDEEEVEGIVGAVGPVGRGRGFRTTENPFSPVSGGSSTTGGDLRFGRSTLNSLSSVSPPSGRPLFQPLILMPPHFLTGLSSSVSSVSSVKSSSLIVDLRFLNLPKKPPFGFDRV